MATPHYDAIIVGSGFGGSVAALRMVEKGYRVLVLEKGRRFAQDDFPKTNWDLRRWLWQPTAGLRGLFQMSFFQHVTVFSGVGVGGGSLVYANTLPVPGDAFFASGSWAGLADWQPELAPHYATAKRMLGATTNPHTGVGDEVLRDVARDLGREEHWAPTEVAVFFGEADKTVPDPFFSGDGPERTGCNGCGACMLGCRVGAKNTLDKNYLWLAERRGLEIRAQHEVTAVRAGREAGGSGYRVEATEWPSGELHKFTADRVFLAGGVLGTVALLLAMRDDADGLVNLSRRVGDLVRTNSESLIAITTPRRDVDLSTGVAITSILHTDDVSHVEPVRYPAGSGFFRLLAMPHAPGSNVPSRLARSLAAMVTSPVAWTRVVLVPDWAKYTQILLYMRTLDGTLSFRLGRSAFSGFRTGLQTALADAAPPKAFMAEATDVARRFAAKLGGVPVSLLSETLLGTPSTAHILGGACIAKDASGGVIGPDHQVHGHPGLYVVDGAAMSANPGVNPSLTITAMAERALAGVPAPTTVSKPTPA